MSYALMNAYDKVREERDKFREHSILLNRIAWKIAKANGKIIKTDTDYYGDVEKELDELLEKLK